MLRLLETIFKNLSLSDRTFEEIQRNVLFSLFCTYYLYIFSISERIKFRYPSQ